MPTSPPPRPRKARPRPGSRQAGGLWSSGHHRRHAPAFPAGFSLPGSGGGRRRVAGGPPFASCHRRDRAMVAPSAAGQRDISAPSVFLQFFFRFILILDSRTARGNTSRAQPGPLSICAAGASAPPTYPPWRNAGQAGGQRDWGSQMPATCVGDSTGPHTWPWAGKPSQARQLMLAATEQAPGLARQATHEALVSWRVAHLEETAVLLVSELVTNVVRHAR